MTDQTPAPRILMLADIAAIAGYAPAADGKLALPNSQTCADELGNAARTLALDGRTQWRPGDPPVGPLALSGAGPVWAYLVIAHALHGLATSLDYASPAATIRVFGHE